MRFSLPCGWFPRFPWGSCPWASPPADAWPSLCWGGWTGPVPAGPSASWWTCPWCAVVPRLPSVCSCNRSSCSTSSSASSTGTAPPSAAALTSVLFATAPTQARGRTRGGSTFPLVALPGPKAATHSACSGSPHPPRATPSPTSIPPPTQPPTPPPLPSPLLPPPHHTRPPCW